MSPKGRRPRFNTPLDEARKRVLGALARPFNYFRPTTRFLIGFFVLALLSTLLLARTRSTMPAAETYSEGDVVRADVVAPADFTAEDTAETERRREAARRRTPSVWNHDPAAAEAAAQSFRSAWPLALFELAPARASACRRRADQLERKLRTASSTRPGS